MNRLTAQDGIGKGHFHPPEQIYHPQTSWISPQPNTILASPWNSSPTRLPPMGAPNFYLTQNIGLPHSFNPRALPAHNPNLQGLRVLTQHNGQNTQQGANQQMPMANPIHFSCQCRCQCGFMPGALINDLKVLHPNVVERPTERFPSHTGLPFQQNVTWTPQVQGFPAAMPKQEPQQFRQVNLNTGWYGTGLLGNSSTKPIIIDGDVDAGSPLGGSKPEDISTSQASATANVAAKRSPQRKAKNPLDMEWYKSSGPPSLMLEMHPKLGETAEGRSYLDQVDRNYQRALTQQNINNSNARRGAGTVTTQRAGAKIPHVQSAAEKNRSRRRQQIPSTETASESSKEQNDADLEQQNDALDSGSHLTTPKDQTGTETHEALRLSPWPAPIPNDEMSHDIDTVAREIEAGIEMMGSSPSLKDSLEPDTAWLAELDELLEVDNWNVAGGDDDSQINPWPMELETPLEPDQRSSSLF